MKKLNNIKIFIFLALVLIPSALVRAAETAATTTPATSSNAMLEKAEKIVQNISSTVNTVANVYAKAEAITNKGQEYYVKGEQFWQKIKPFVERLRPAYEFFKKVWLKISNNNEPKRVLILIGVVIIGWLLLKLGRRRRNQFS